ncbi:MAG: hypothetical protein R6U31_05780, partial [bacterium]
MQAVFKSFHRISTPSSKIPQDNEVFHKTVHMRITALSPAILFVEMFFNRIIHILFSPDDFFPNIIHIDEEPEQGDLFYQK